MFTFTIIYFFVVLQVIKKISDFFCICCTFSHTVFVLQVIESISDWANDKARENPGCVERFYKKDIK